MDERNAANLARYRPGRPGGHYESYFVRANHPARPEAFWIRCTIFHLGDPLRRRAARAHRGASRAADRRVRVRRERVPRPGAGSELGPGRLRGAAGSGAGAIAWDLAWDGDAPVAYVLLRRRVRAPHASQGVTAGGAGNGDGAGHRPGATAAESRTRGAGRPAHPRGPREAPSMTRTRCSDARRGTRRPGSCGARAAAHSVAWGA
jgi:hypothetical protein